MVALIRESNSSSPRIASCKWRGVIRLTLRSLDALPASSSTSAVRYSRIAALYTAAVAPTLPWLVVRVFKCLWMRPTGNCSPALCERDTALALAFPLSFPALPPANAQFRTQSQSQQQRRCCGAARVVLLRDTRPQPAHLDSRRRRGERGRDRWQPGRLTPAPPMSSPPDARRLNR